MAHEPERVAPTRTLPWQYPDAEGDQAVTLETRSHMVEQAHIGTLIEAFTAHPGIHYDAGGFLDDGQGEWAVLKRGEAIEIPGDPSLTGRYIVLHYLREGEGTCQAVALNIRMAGANTWRCADFDHGDRAFAIFENRKSWRLDDPQFQADVRTAVVMADEEMTTYAELAKKLLTMPVTAEQESLFVEQVIGPDAKPDKLLAILSSPAYAGIRGTAYGLAQAAGEYLDHERPHTGKHMVLRRTLFYREHTKKRVPEMALLAADGLL